MRSFSVVPDEPKDQLTIELIGDDEQLFVIINELLLNGRVKTSMWAFILGVLG
jgi:hypothetical protein